MRQDGTESAGRTRRPRWRGILGAAGATALSRESLPDGTDGGHDDEARAASPAELVDALVATAHVVYPSEVSNVDEFVETYATGRIENRPEYREGRWRR
ncbi:hypothetical protein VB773_15710 [Haloarculaceae archaeon H-GB2-1]|nr:hypothetical protein [Haloarculaceae archaeon H-GB11]MEA5408869.1 hypothetical protein [Haloarculaceae archaeon H-GB2-1]